MKGGVRRELYGAGILSSFGESNHIYNDPIEVLPYDIEAVIHNHFVNSEIQMRYYEIGTFEDLYHSLDRLEAIAKAGLDLEARIPTRSARRLDRFAQLLWVALANHLAGFFP